MTFLHELAHAYFGDIDVTKDNVYSIDEQVPDRPQPDFYVGKAAQRVNIYRKELKMPTRASYAPYQYKQGDPACWKQFDGRVAFKNGNKGIIYQKLR